MNRTMMEADEVYKTARKRIYKKLELNADLFLV